MPQRHPDKSSVARYLVDKGLDSIPFAYVTWHGTRWPTVTIVLN
jgi:hypothetical protein